MSRFGPTRLDSDLRRLEHDEAGEDRPRGRGIVSQAHSGDRTYVRPTPASAYGAGSTGYGSAAAGIVYSFASPSAIHTVSQGAESTVRIARFFGRLGGGSGSSVGAGNGAGAATGDEAPTAFQSGRAALGRIGVRGGSMIAAAGLRQLAATSGALAEEDAAANGADGSSSSDNAAKYLQAEAVEHEGVVGAIRERLHGDPKGDAALRSAVADDVASQQQVIKARQAGKIIERTRAQEQRSAEEGQEQLAETTATNADDRGRLKTDFKDRRAAEKINQQFDTEAAAMRAEAPNQADPKF